MIQKFLIVCIVFIGGSKMMYGQELQTYQFYNQKGKRIDFGRMVQQLKTYDVILFGEYHDNSTTHWLQLQLAKSLNETNGKKLILGAEMFERDNQPEINRYLSHQITENEFKRKVRLWNNFKTDYQPLLEFSKKNSLEFIATNVPRKYASQVAKFGLESLDTLQVSEKKFIVKFPFPIDYQAPGYPEMIAMMDNHAGTKAKQFVAAQAIKDATMAETILNNVQSNMLFLHFNGDYHSKQFGGIYWYLKHWQPSLKVAVIQVLTSSHRNLDLVKPLEENFILTDFTLVLPEDTIKTY